VLFTPHAQLIGGYQSVLQLQKVKDQVPTGDTVHKSRAQDFQTENSARATLSSIRVRYSERRVLMARLPAAAVVVLRLNRTG